MQREKFVKLSSILLMIVFLFACSANQDAPKNTAKANGYIKLGLPKTDIKPWEDGMRTTGDKGSYEWWYFDANLKDGSTLVIAFYTKESLQPDTPLKPRVTFELAKPDGTTVHKVIETGAGDFVAARDKCDVRIKTNTFRGDLHDYTIHVEIDDVKADIQLHGTVPPWRPDTDKGKDYYFGWLPAVSKGNVQGTITIAGQSQKVTGIGYHDHNWGNVPMVKMFHNWYWGRAQIGQYSLIASYLKTQDKNAPPAPIFMLARDGKILTNGGKVKFSTEGVYIDSLTGKPVANTIIYDYEDDVNRYRVTFKRDKDILRIRFLDNLHGLKLILGKLAGFDGAYLRFTGQVTLERFDGNKFIETVSEKAAVWELMYFGNRL
jgi:hypothetical protein